MFTESWRKHWINENICHLCLCWQSLPNKSKWLITTYFCKILSRAHFRGNKSNFKSLLAIIGDRQECVWWCVIDKRWSHHHNIRYISVSQLQPDQTKTLDCCPVPRAGPGLLQISCWLWAWPPPDETVGLDYSLSLSLSLSLNVRQPFSC